MINLNTASVCGGHCTQDGSRSDTLQPGHDPRPSFQALPEEYRQVKWNWW